MNILSYFQELKIQFRRNVFFLWTIFLLLLFKPVLSFYSSTDWVEFIILSAFCYLFSCLLSFILALVPTLRLFLGPLSLIAITSFDLLAIICFVQFDMPIDITAVETLLATNWSEVQEFISIFIPLWVILIFVSILIVVVGIDFTCLQKNWSMGESQYNIHIHAVLYLMIVLGICHRRVSETLIDIEGWTIPFETIAVNLSDYEPQSLDLCESSAHHPQKIVLIIGESHSKGHSSLYGYRLQTNPRIEALINDSSVIVFKDAISPATVTVESFQYLLNTRHISDCEEPWYHFPSVITAMKTAGYQTSWYSNQDEVGLFDNIASSYAHICDNCTFNTDDQRLDGSLVGLHHISDSLEFVIYHLRGQHVDFSLRYPHEGYSRFKAEDYPGLSSKMAQTAAHYDNACLYNDAVLSDLMLEFKEQNAIVLYFPDHGLDVFQSSPFYAGHARRLDRESERIGREIPFLVYVTDSYKEQNSELVNQIRTRAENTFCTDDITNFVMEIAGYDIIRY